MSLKDSILIALREDETCRVNDMVLMARLISDRNNNLSEQQEKMLIDILKNWQNYKLPNYETVTRFRRELQAKNQELRNADKYRIRKRREQIFREHYRHDRHERR